MFIFYFLDEGAVCWFELSLGVILGCDSSLCNDIDMWAFGLCQSGFIFNFIEMCCTLKAIKASN